MNPAGTEQFYSRLPVNEIPLADLLTEEHLFFKVPEDWHVIITDVKGSTLAVRNGLHETVNLVATGSIVAVLNIAYRLPVTIPFFFGGDGATFIIPPGLLDTCLKALALHRDNTRKNFNLDIRVGQVPVREIYSAGHNIRITKLKTSQLFNIPVMLGDGLAYAEKIIKSEDYAPPRFAEPEGELDMTGMECRWNRILPPVNFDEVVSLLVLARHPDEQAIAFNKVISAIDRIYGAPEQRKPITENRLRLNATAKKISREMRVKLGGFRLLYLLRKMVSTTLGKLYFSTPTGKSYLRQLVQLSDTLVIDGRINTVISGTGKQREELTDHLDSLEKQGLILYGLFVSRDSVLSCYVRNMNEDHIHFVDGSEGGYTMAATVLKQKIKEINGANNHV